MPHILGDNTVIPSYLGASRRGGSPGRSAMLNDYVLRLGEVKKIIYPDDPLSYGKKTVEYEVEVQYREGNGTYTTSLYRGVTVSTAFGGIADRFHVTFRADTGNTQNDTGDGSKVLLLCLSGDQQKAIILGGVEDPTDERVEEKDDGHNLFWEFNGIRFTINKDGELTLLFRGATAETGDLKDGVDEKASGATVNIDKKGSVTVKTVDGEDVEHQVVLNHDSGDIEIKTTGNWKSTVDKAYEMEAKKGFKLTSADDQMEVQVKKNVIIKSDGVKVGDAKENWVLGKTWRQDLKSLHSSLKSSLNSASQNLMQAAIQLKIAAGLNSIPYTGGSAAQSSFQQVSSGLNSASSDLSQAASAIDSYESNAGGHLSKKNFGD